MVIIRKNLSPDAPSPGGAAPAKKSKKSVQPEKDDDVLTVATSVYGAWGGDSSLTLKWIKQPDFKTLVINYEETLGERQSAGGNRPGQTQDLKNINKTIDTGASGVKTYIDKKFKTKANAKAQYARYGFKHKRDSYQIPTDHDKRKASLKLMVAAIVADGFGSEEYGTIFWTGVQTDFNNAIGTAGDTDKTVSGKVGDKNNLKKQVLKVLVALRLLLEANYPDTYQSVVRSWGWLKEDY